MTIASIDIGSNTVLLLIAEYDPAHQVITSAINRYMSPRLGEGLFLGTRISKSKINLLMTILSDYKNISIQNNCSVILLRATNAFRIASNSFEIVKLVKEKLDLEIEIISGDEEARLTFLGSAFPFNRNESKSVIDIGGGSTEVIYGNRKEIIFKKSLNIGVVSLTEKFFLTLPPSNEAVHNANKYINEVFVDLANLIPAEVDTIAVAGTPTALSCIKQGIKLYDDKLVDNSILSITELSKIIDQLSNMSKEEVLFKYGKVVIGREDLLLAGSIILQMFMQKLRLTNLIISSKGLRYGTVIDYLIRNQLMDTEK